MNVLREVAPREEVLTKVIRELGFPWELPPRETPLALEDAAGFPLGETLLASQDHPPFSRSLRDGFAVRCEETAGASPGTPAFLRLAGEVPMGGPASESLRPGEVLSIHTGGMLPPGADGVLMLEDATVTAGWVEARKALQRGENVVFQGEEYRRGDSLLTAGSRLDERHVGIFAALGKGVVPGVDLSATVLSTGDEVVPLETDPVPQGCVRDVNGWFLTGFLRRRGFRVRHGGILRDDPEALATGFQRAFEESDLILLSGGSSVSVRDHCEEILSQIPAPGLMVRGVNIQPGKPTHLAGSLVPRRLVVGFPGHPLACATVAYTVLLPLLGAWMGSPETWTCRKERVTLLRDLVARAGVEEFVPGRWTPQGVVPLPSASGYVAALREADGFLRFPQERETARSGEEVEFWWIPR